MRFCFCVCNATIQQSTSMLFLLLDVHIINCVWCMLGLHQHFDADTSFTLFFTQIRWLHLRTKPSHLLVLDALLIYIVLWVLCCVSLCLSYATTMMFSNHVGSSCECFWLTKEHLRAFFGTLLCLFYTNRDQIQRFCHPTTDVVGFGCQGQTTIIYISLLPAVHF